MSKASYDDCVNDISWAYELEKVFLCEQLPYLCMMEPRYHKLKFISAQSLLIDHGKQEDFHLSMEW